MKFKSNMVSRAKKIFSPSQGKEKISNGGNPVGELEFGSKVVDSRFSTGSKEEIFFDSRGWIDSDCEDDYVNAGVDFAPSQGSTPNHQLGTQAPPQLSKVHFVDDPDNRSEHSPDERKKNLSDFLQENMPGEVVNEQKVVTEKRENNENLHDNKLETDTTYLSGAHNSEQKKEKTWKKRHCCLPSLIHTRSMNDRRKKKFSPEPLSF